MTNKTLADKIAIITGGSGGIGSAVCLKLAQQGAQNVKNIIEGGLSSRRSPARVSSPKKR